MAKYENGESTKKAILASAYKLFCLNGVENTTFDEIAKDSHVSKTSIIYHFKTKEALNQEASSAVMDKIYKKVESLLQTPKMNLIISSYVFWYHFFEDEKFRNWVTYCLKNDKSNEVWTKKLYILLKQAYDLPDSYNSFVNCHPYACLFAGAVEWMLCEHISHNIIQYHDYAEVAEREIQMISRMFAVPEEKTVQYISDARRLMELVDVTQLAMTVGE